MNALTSAVTRPVPSARVDYSDGINDALEVALHPNVDLVMLEAAAPNLHPGTQAFYNLEITRADQPEFKQVIQGKAEMGLDGFSCKADTFAGTPGAPETSILEGTVFNPFGGSQTDGWITPSQRPTPNEQIQLGVNWNGATVVQGQMDGLPIQESSQMSFNSMTPTWHHEGSIAGVAFERDVTLGTDGVTRIQGRFGELEETGTLQLGWGGMVISRDIGPYHVQGTLWYEQPAPPGPPPSEPPPPPPPDEPVPIDHGAPGDPIPPPEGDTPADTTYHSADPIPPPST